MIVRHEVPEDDTGTRLHELRAARAARQLSAREQVELSTLESRARGRDAGELKLLTG